MYDLLTTREKITTTGLAVLAGAIIGVGLNYINNKNDIHTENVAVHSEPGMFSGHYDLISFNEGHILQKKGPTIFGNVRTFHDINGDLTVDYIQVNTPGNKFKEFYACTGSQECTEASKELAELVNKHNHNQ